MVRAPAIFLRTGCTLPGGLDLKQKLFDKAWMSVENAAPAQLDVAVRNAGWHFMWMATACSRFGLGRTGEDAARQAIGRALSQAEARYNAAELEVVHTSRYLGLHLAKARLHTRHIQQGAALGIKDELTDR